MYNDFPVLIDTMKYSSNTELPAQCSDHILKGGSVVPLTKSISSI